MNLPGHRIAACLGKAALKTHALQTLTRRPLTRPEARSVWSASDLSALSVRRGTASSSLPQYMRKSERRLSMNQPTPDPSQEGNCRDADDRLLPSREESGVGSGSQCTASKSWRLSTSERTALENVVRGPA